MDTLAQRGSQLMAQIKSIFTGAWYALRNPKLTGGLLIALAVIFLLSWLLPQQSITISTATARTLWVNNLPWWLQSVGGLLFSLGMARIFQSIWFWLPVALLLLNSLIAVADYAPGSWRRLRKTMPPLNWQHPLVTRSEHSVRLSNFPDNFDEIFRQQLSDQSFILYQSSETDKHIIAAGHRRWAWLGVVLFYIGLLVLIGAFLLTYFTLKTERFTLSPEQPKLVQVIGGTFELISVAPELGVSQLTYIPSDTQTPQTLTWRSYQPVLINGTFLLPTAINPVLTVAAYDAQGNSLDLIPLEGTTSSSDKDLSQLSFTLRQGESSVYFTVPAIDAAVQVSPNSELGVYKVQVRSDAETVIFDEQVSAGEKFLVVDTTMTLSLHHTVQSVARRDNGLLLYIVALILVVVGVVFTLLRPAIVWLISDVKGIGGQFYGVIETFGGQGHQKNFLETLLTTENIMPEEDGN